MPDLVHRTVAGQAYIADRTTELETDAVIRSERSAAPASVSLV